MLTIDVAKGSHEAFYLFKGGVKRFLVYGEAGKWRLAKPGKDETPEFDTLFAALHAAIQQDKLEESAKKLVGTSSVECPHCGWGFDPSMIDQHIRTKHGLE